VSDPALEGDSDRGMAVVWTGGDFFSESVGDMLEAEMRVGRRRKVGVRGNKGSVGVRTAI
jgi:hypothetical protein